MTNNNNKKIFSAGEYSHFKGGIYDAYCTAYDEYCNEYILYKSTDKGETYKEKEKDEDTEKYWIRPENMFNEKVCKNGQEYRFQLIKEMEQSELIDSLENELRKGSLVLKHTENSEPYIIKEIRYNEGNNRFEAIISEYHPEKTVGYLSDYELAWRLGYILYKYKGTLKWAKYDNKDYSFLPQRQELQIGKYIKTEEKEEDETNKLERNVIIETNDSVMSKINVCSIDMEISDCKFKQSKKGILLDLKSIKNFFAIEKYWKNVKIYTDKKTNDKYLILKPKQTLLTRTRDIIRIPEDCIGKMEIRNKYARMSLSISSSDYLNPGYVGYFPFQITNHGNHKVRIYIGERMAQLLLSKVNGPIINNYSKITTLTNDRKVDDGTPFYIFKEFIVNEKKEIYDMYNFLTDNQDHSFTDRVEKTFLNFCEKNYIKDNYKKEDKFDIKELLKQYTKSEETKKKIWDLKWVPDAAIVIDVLVVIIQILAIGAKNVSEIMTYIIPCLIIAVLFIIIHAILHFAKPNCFCTMENMKKHLPVGYWENKHE